MVYYDINADGYMYAIKTDWTEKTMFCDQLLRLFILLRDTRSSQRFPINTEKQMPAILNLFISG